MKPLNNIHSTISTQQFPLNKVYSRISTQQYPLNNISSTMSSQHYPVNTIQSTIATPIPYSTYGVVIGTRYQYSRCHSTCDCGHAASKKPSQTSCIHHMKPLLNMHSNIHSTISTQQYTLNNIHSIISSQQYRVKHIHSAISIRQYPVNNIHSISTQQ